MKKYSVLALSTILAIILSLSVSNAVVLVKASTGHIHIDAPSVVAAGEIVNLDFSSATFSDPQFYLLISEDNISAVSSGDNRYTPTLNVADVQSSTVKTVEGYKIGKNWINGSIPNGITGKYYIKAYDGNASEVAVSDNFINVDGNPPLIGIPTQNPPVTNVQTNQAVTVSVNVTDVESGVGNVRLLYKTVTETMWRNLVMHLNDSSGLYEVAVPGQPEGTWVTYIIVACDSVGNIAIQDDKGLYFTYPVIPEIFPSIITILLFFAVALLALMLYKKKKA